ncbi:MAG: NusG domain II-containing protein [Oscillospiraceae bacterium]
MALWLGGRSASGMTANIYQDGVCIASFDLSRVTGTELYTVECDAGTNVIQIEPGRICVREAGCSVILRCSSCADFCPQADLDLQCVGRGGP